MPSLRCLTYGKSGIQLKLAKSTAEKLLQAANQLRRQGPVYEISTVSEQLLRRMGLPQRSSPDRTVRSKTSRTRLVR